MAKQIKILTALLLMQPFLYGQINYSSKGFHKHIQTCHLVGTIDKDYVIVLNADSTINIIIYTSSYRDVYNSLFKQVYDGIYAVSGDTIKVKFIENTSARKSKFTSHISPDLRNDINILRYPKTAERFPSTTYILNGNEIIATDGWFPTLKNSSAANIMLIESKFMNWTKPSALKNEIFKRPW